MNKLNKENKKLIQHQMKRMNTDDVNVVISDMIKQDLSYQIQIKKLRAVIAKYDEAFKQLGY